MTQNQELENLNMLRESGVISEKDYKLQCDAIQKKYNILPEPDLGVWDYTRMWFRRAFTWRGRANRSEFWWPLVILFSILLLFSLMLFLLIPFLLVLILIPILGIIIAILLFIISIWISIALMSATVRRFHDLGLSTWMGTIPWMIYGIKCLLGLSGLIAFFATGILTWEAITLFPKLVLENLNENFPFFIKTLSVLNIAETVAMGIYLIICMFPGQKGANQYGAPRV